MTLGFVYSTMTIAIIFPKVDKVIGIMGGLLAPTLDYLIPMYCYVKLSDNKWTHWKNLTAIIFFSFLCFIGYTAVFIIFYEIITDKKEMPKWKWIGGTA
jgi:amino acid permease